jgi:hypothetical protein
MPTASALIEIVIVLLVSPGWKVSVPLAAP